MNDEHKLRISVKGIITNPNNEVLLVRCRTEQAWSYPGGGVEDGESFVETLKREILEETGLSTDIDEKIVFVLDLTFENNRRQIELFFTGKTKHASLDHDKCELESIFVNKEEFCQTHCLPKDIDPFHISSSIPYYLVDLPRNINVAK